MMQTLLLAALAFVAQDGDATERIGRLLERLGSDSVVERDEASDALERFGPSALPALRKSLEGAAGELRARAEAVIRAIERNRTIAGLKATSEPLTVRTRDVAAAELARTLGVRADAPVAERRLSLQIEKATLLQALDVLCAGTADLTHERSGAEILLKAGRHPACPAAYEGPFRLRVLSLQAKRSQTFLEHAVLLQLKLGADHDGSVRPLPHPAIEIEEVLDDRGGVVTLTRPAPHEAGQARAGRPEAEGVVFFSKDLSPEATRLARIRAVVRPVFVLGSEDVVFPSPSRGDVRDLGPYRATITGLTTDSAAATTTLQLTFTADGLQPEALRRAVEDRFERSAVVLVDAAGEEIAGQPTHPHRVFLHPEEAQRSVDFHFTFAKRLPRGERKALRLRFHTDTWEHEVRFELKDVKLP